MLSYGSSMRARGSAGHPDELDGAERNSEDVQQVLRLSEYPPPLPRSGACFGRSRCSGWEGAWYPRPRPGAPPARSAGDGSTTHPPLKDPTLILRGP